MNKAKLNSGRVNQKLRTREKILKAAIDLLKSKSEFTLEDVAAHMNSSRATVYRYFSNVDVLCAEAALSLHTKTTDELLDEVKDLGLLERLLYIQRYFNTLAQKHEVAFRKYLSFVLAESSKGVKLSSLRGSRRPLVLEKSLSPFKDEISPKNARKLHLLTSILSGIEPLIVNKDVNRIGRKESDEVLKWALEMIVKGMKSK